MAEFGPAITFVLQHEDPGLTGAVTTDSGGLTRWGISQRSYPNLDIANLSLADAETIYQRDYWEPVQGDQINAQPIASKLLDMAVNMGVWTGCKLIQQAVGVEEDGIIGPITLAAINNADPENLLDQMRFMSADHYRWIAQTHPGEAVYLKGWLKRAAD